MGVCVSLSQRALTARASRRQPVNDCERLCPPTPFNPSTPIQRVRLRLVAAPGVTVTARSAPQRCAARDSDDDSYTSAANLEGTGRRLRFFTEFSERSSVEIAIAVTRFPAENAQNRTALPVRRFVGAWTKMAGKSRIVHFGMVMMIARFVMETRRPSLLD